MFAEIPLFLFREGLLDPSKTSGSTASHISPIPPMMSGHFGGWFRFPNEPKLGDDDAIITLAWHHHKNHLEGAFDSTNHYMKHEIYSTLRILTPQKWLFWGPKNTPASYRFKQTPAVKGFWGLLGKVKCPSVFTSWHHHETDLNPKPVGSSNLWSMISHCYGGRSRPDGKRLTRHRGQVRPARAARWKYLFVVMCIICIFHIRITTICTQKLHVWNIYLHLP